MHEAYVAQNLLETILGEAGRHKARPIEAWISCGMLSAINDQALCFAFEALSAGTSCEGMRVNIEHKPLEAECGGCGERFEVPLGGSLCGGGTAGGGDMPLCPRCGGADFDLLPDAPLLLEKIEFLEGAANG
jgi:hydrogenase nickel incorporation protein HypA/HybF